MTTNVSFCWNGKVDTFLDVEDDVLLRTINSLKQDQDWKIKLGVIKKAPITLKRGYIIIIENELIFKNLNRSK